MDQPDDTATRELLAHVLVPVAHEDDARVTARALESYEPAHVTALHVVEKADGAPDKLSVEQAEEIAADSFAAVREVFPDADAEIAYKRNVVEAIFDVASEVEASAIAYHPREGNRLLRLLSGDLSLKLVTQTDRPVVALPDVNQTEN